MPAPVFKREHQITSAEVRNAGNKVSLSNLITLSRFVPEFRNSHLLKKRNGIGFQNIALQTLDTLSPIRNRSLTR